MATIQLPSDFNEFLKLLIKNEVRYRMSPLRDAARRSGLPLLKVVAPSLAAHG